MCAGCLDTYIPVKCPHAPPLPRGVFHWLQPPRRERAGEICQDSLLNEENGGTDGRPLGVVALLLLPPTSPGTLLLPPSRARTLLCGSGVLRADSSCTSVLEGGGGGAGAGTKARKLKSSSTAAAAALLPLVARAAAACCLAVIDADSAISLSSDVCLSDGSSGRGKGGPAPPSSSSIAR